MENNTTITRSELNAKIAAKKFAKNNIVGNLLADIQQGKKIRPIYSSSGSWKHSSLIDKSFQLKIVLKEFGLQFVEGNDAPRGGKTGYYIEITSTITE